MVKKIDPVVAARNAVAAAVALVEEKRLANVEANSAAWKAHHAYEDAVKDRDAKQAALEAALAAAKAQPDPAAEVG